MSLINNSLNSFCHGRKAFVITSHLGTAGGAALAPLLLSEALEGLGLEVTIFAQNLVFGEDEFQKNLQIVTPWLKRGCRWDIPEQVLALQVARAVKRQQPDYVFMCGITRLARYLLMSDIAGHLMVWEFTNANGGNKFVNEYAIHLLEKCRLILSPSAAIDQGIRQTYGFGGLILRLPFWIADNGIPLNKPVSLPAVDFIYLGRRDPEKGLHELIAATALAAASYPDISVLISGQGNQSMYEIQSESLGVKRNVQFQFFHTHTEVMDALRQSRCLVLPSYHEGYPLVLLEAAAHGIPFIATRVGSVAEIFEGSEAGLIIPPKDKDALAEAMLQILGENEQAYCNRKSAARRVFERISSKEVVRGNLEKVLLAASNRNVNT